MKEKVACFSEWMTKLDVIDDSCDPEIAELYVELWAEISLKIAGSLLASLLRGELYFYETLTD